MTAGVLEAAAASLAREQPAVTIDPTAFQAYLETEVGVRVDEVIAGGQVEDLMLAFACVRGQDGALALFYARHQAMLRRVIARTCADPGEVDDLFHDLIIKLTLARGESPPGLTRYQGRGKLATWLRVVGARVAIDRARQSTALLMTDSLLDVVDGANVEPSQLESYRERFKVAVVRALTELEPRERRILRYHLAGVAVGDIARLMGHHRVTVSRWLSAIREQLRERTLLELAELSTAGAEDLPLGELLPHLSASFDRLLAAGG